LLKTGSRSNRLRFIGDHFPPRISKADFDFGPGISLRRILSNNGSEVTVEVDVARGAPRGKRNVAFQRSVLANGLAVYDRVDYIKVKPESAMAAFGNQNRLRGFQQFEAIGYGNGPDAKRHTSDDVELGLIDVTWSMRVFYETVAGHTDLVGTVSPKGLFVPAGNSLANNYDVWVIAEAKTEKDKAGEPLSGKSYLVVTVPFYTFNGRRYVRELDRWVDDGPAQPVREERK
jgi:quinohemoprotein amine dehydrogenase